uniref:DUF4442 domain-containing protein n=1 Tax=Flavobacterium sp. TaxID=239 RepID=UPI00404B47CE
MHITASKLNTFLFFKLPSAFWCGVRVLTIDNNHCVVKVKHRWINQNPFKSMYFAVQAMAAELSTGALVMLYIKKSGKNISMLVANNQANFSKKATGKITFTCVDGAQLQNAIEEAVETGNGQTFWLESKGIDEKGDCVSTFKFEWTIKIKK